MKPRDRKRDLSLLLFGVIPGVILIAWVEFTPILLSVIEHFFCRDW